MTGTVASAVSLLDLLSQADDAPPSEKRSNEYAFIIFFCCVNLCTVHCRFLQRCVEAYHKLEILHPSHINDLEITDVKKAIENLRGESLTLVVTPGIINTCAQLFGDSMFGRPCWADVEGRAFTQEASNRRGRA